MPMDIDKLVKKRRNHFDQEIAILSQFSKDGMKKKRNCVGWMAVHFLLHTNILYFLCKRGDQNPRNYLRTLVYFRCCFLHFFYLSSTKTIHPLLELNKATARPLSGFSSQQHSVNSISKGFINL